MLTKLTLRNFKRFEVAMRVILALTVTGVLTISCHPPGRLLEGPVIQTKDYEFQAPRDAVWDAIVDYLTRTGFTITTIDKASGFINVDRSLADNSYMICRETLPDVPTENITESDHTLSFTVVIREGTAENQSKVAINLRTLALVGARNSMLAGRWLYCPSSGKIESDLREEIINALNLVDQQLNSTQKNQVEPHETPQKDSDEDRQGTQPPRPDSKIIGIIGTVAVAVLALLFWP